MTQIYSSCKTKFCYIHILLKIGKAPTRRVQQPQFLSEHFFFATKDFAELAVLRRIARGSV
jgi:hypothetical protein